MKKVLSFLFLSILVSCGQVNIENKQATGEVIETQVSVLTESSESLDSPDSVEDSDMDMTTTDQVISISDMLQKLPEIYSKNNDFRYCVSYNLDSCIADIRSQNPEATSCDDFITTESKNYCKVSEVTAKAKEAGNVDLCDGLDGAIESCKYEVSIGIGITSGKVDSCDILSEGYVNSCKNEIIKFTARQEKQASLCDALFGDKDMIAYEIEYCKEAIEMEIRQAEEDAKMEEEIEAEEKRQAEEDAKMNQQEE